jgi:hypothetical protein
MSFFPQKKAGLDLAWIRGSEGISGSPLEYRIKTCLNAGRNFIGVELDKGYFETAKERVEEAARKSQDLR